MTEESSSEATATTTILHMLPIDVAEQVQVMRLREESTYKCRDIFGEEADSSNGSTRNHSAQHVVLDAECRRKMCQWFFEIVDFCQCGRETVDIAMSFLDRFLGTRCSEAQKALQDKRQYQLASVTALYLAMKLHETMDMEAALLSKISRGEFSTKDIVEMERTMLTALQWRLHGPTRLTFALFFLALLPAQLRDNLNLAETLLELIHFQTEKATLDYFFTTRKQSTAGLACVLNALEAAGLGQDAKDAFRNAAIRYGGMNPFSVEVQEARLRLVHAAAADCQLHSFFPVATSRKEFMETTAAAAAAAACSKVSCCGRCTKERENDHNHPRQSSPVCVSRAAIEE